MHCPAYCVLASIGSWTESVCVCVYFLFQYVALVECMYPVFNRVLGGVIVGDSGSLLLCACLCSMCDVNCSSAITSHCLLILFSSVSAWATRLSTGCYEIHSSEDGVRLTTTWRGHWKRSHTQSFLPMDCTSMLRVCVGVWVHKLGDPQSVQLRSATATTTCGSLDSIR